MPAQLIYTSRRAPDLSDADIDDLLHRARRHNALHGLSGEMGIDHGALSDIASMTHGVKSMTQLSQDQMLGMYEDLMNQQSASNPLVPKSAAITVGDLMRKK